MISFDLLSGYTVKCCVIKFDLLSGHTVTFCVIIFDLLSDYTCRLHLESSDLDAAWFLFYPDASNI